MRKYKYAVQFFDRNWVEKDKDMIEIEISDDNVHISEVKSKVDKMAKFLSSVYGHENQSTIRIG